MYCYKKDCKNIVRHELHVRSGENTEVNVGTCSVHRSEARKIMHEYRDKANELLTEYLKAQQDLKDEFEEILFG